MPSPIYKEFGDRIKDLRLCKELTQSEIASKLNIAQTTYAGYELGTRKIPLEVIVSLSKILDVSPDYLILGKEKAPAGLESLAGERDGDIKKFIGNLLISLDIASPEHPISEADQQLIAGILDIIEAYRRK